MVDADYADHGMMDRLVAVDPDATQSPATTAASVANDMAERFGLSRRKVSQIVASVIAEGNGHVPAGKAAA